MRESIFIGFDPKEDGAFAVARETVKQYLTRPIPVYGLLLDDLVKRGLYQRPIEYRPSAADKPLMWDLVSDAPMSTQHANARFFVPMLAKEGWALFMDGDMLVRDNLARVFDGLDPAKAVYCVQHRHEPEPGTKMEGQLQTRYARKNWSSFCVFNCDHPANKALTLDVLNNTPGRDLHRFFWLADCDIGVLPQEYNFLVGHTDPAIEPKVVHFTDGCPDMDGYHDVPFSDEWREKYHDWARGTLSFGS